MKKKILFIIWSFTYGGGAEKILANIVNNMDLEKYDIDILEYWHADINEEKVKKEINILPPVIDSTRDSHIKMHYYKYLLEHNPEKLRKKYIKKEYDYEISFNILIPSFLLSKSAKTISWNHGSIEDLKNRKKDLRLQKNVFENVNKIVAISEKTYNSIIDIFPEYADKTVIINNGFDFSDVLNKSKSKSGEHKNSNKFKFVFAGRFDKNKNPLFLIEIAKKLKQDNIDFQLLMLGKGELQEKVIKKINEYDLNDYVQLLGYKKNPYTYYKEADAILLCSYSEGFPTVLAEGLILGKPFVSTNVGGVIELSDNNTCGFVADNLDEYYKYCKELICNKNLYNKMSISAKKNIQKFTIEKQVHRLENLINEIDRGGGQQNLNNSNKLISIIVPVYNVERYLDKCLNSLINQTLKNIEIIIVNDGSPDNSQDIIDEYVRKYPKKVKSFKKQNGGLSSARNYGLEYATGEYISFVDSDDWLDLDLLEKMYNSAIKNDSDIVICDMKDHYTDGTFINLNCTKFNNVFEVTASACNKLFKKKAIGDIRFLNGIWYEDLNFTTKILLNKLKISEVSDAYYNCSCRDDSIMHNSNSIKNLDIIISIDDLIKYAKNNNLYDKNVISSLIFNHILVTGINRVNKVNGKDNKKIIKNYIKYCHDNISDYKKMPFYASISVKKRIIANLNYNSMYNLSKFILEIKSKIKKVNN